MIDHSSMRLGKLPVRHNPRLPRLSLYTVNLPQRPPAADWSRNVRAWGEMRNNQIGDCTAAGAAHAIQVWTSSARNAQAVITDDQVVGFYSAASGYNPADPATDQGAAASDVLDWWHAHSFAGHSLDAFATLKPGDVGDACNAIWLTGGAYLGLELPVTAQVQDVWDATALGTAGAGAPGSWGGHCVWAYAYDAHGLWCVTWGAPKRMTWAFFQAYCSEGYGLLSRDWITATGHAPNGFDWQTLIADMAALSQASPAAPPVSLAPSQNGESPMADIPSTATIVVTPVVPAASSFGLTVSTLINGLLQGATSIGGALAGAGFMQVAAKLLDPSNGFLASVANGNVLIGALLAGGSWWASHVIISGSNQTTLSVVGR